MLKNRLVPTNEIIQLLKNQNCQFYVLNPNPGTENMRALHSQFSMISLDKYIKDTHDTAALMKNMDLVISIDSFPIHLAGALGVKAYLMLSFDSDWRWFNDYDTTPWYNSVKVFKQNYPNDCHSVVDRISKELKQL